MMHALVFLLGWLLADAALAAEPGGARLSGHVVSVLDGDTMTVQSNGKNVRVRLAEIDAPELGQPYGEQARASLAQICLDKEALVSIVGRRSGQVLGRVTCEAVDANAEQVGRGFAWVYRRQPKSESPLFFLEDAAQRARSGLWSDPAPAPPWRWRSNRRRSADEG